MKITDLLSKESVLLNADVNDKEACLVKLVDLMDASGKISDRESYLNAVHEREKEGTTGVGNGIAIPHGRCKGVKEPGLAAMTIPSGVEYKALDSKPVDLAFLIAAPEGSGSMHLEILSKLATMLMDENFVADLKKAKTVEEFLKVIDDAEEKK
ncbi:MAG: PTS sugar transporter subunit IIA, partial [Erysipelotrichaceae bacterium]|nr:PTS sugar transporter subunit IIA [Erysipelotrichaceae bacterium]